MALDAYRRGISAAAGRGFTRAGSLTWGTYPASRWAYPVCVSPELDEPNSPTFR
jgi:hypothetical protein